MTRTDYKAALGRMGLDRGTVDGLAGQAIFGRGAGCAGALADALAVAREARVHRRRRVDALRGRDAAQAIAEWARG